MRPRGRSMFPRSNQVLRSGEIVIMKNSHLLIGGFVLLIASLGCNSNQSAAGNDANSVKLQGAGASFPAPLYTKWFKSFGSNRKDVLVDYQSVGSGAGVKGVIDKTVDFGASDAA